MPRDLEPPLALGKKIKMSLLDKLLHGSEQSDRDSGWIRAMLENGRVYHILRTTAANTVGRQGVRVNNLLDAAEWETEAGWTDQSREIMLQVTSTPAFQRILKENADRA